MERVTRVLQNRAGDIAGHLSLREELAHDVAERFVKAAGEELLASWEWQASSLQLESLPTWTNVQMLLGGIHAKALADDLGLPPDQVWRALRTFVPRVLILASRDEDQPARGPRRARRPRRRRSVDLTIEARASDPAWGLGGPSPSLSPG